MIKRDPNRQMYIENVFHILGNDITLQLFKHIVGQGPRPKTTKKQYYIRMQKLQDIGLIEHTSFHQYTITSLGQVITYIINLTERVLNLSGRLFTLDALQLANRLEEIKDITPIQWHELIQSTIQDKMVENIIFGEKTID